MEYVINSASYGRMAELVDASVLGTDIERCVGSSPISPTKNVDKSVYSVVNDKSTSSTIATIESVVYKKKVLSESLRKNCTFHLNNTCGNYYLIPTGLFNLNSTTHLWWSCRRSTKTISRRTPVSLFYKEMFSLCPQKHTRPHYSYN